MSTVTIYSDAYIVIVEHPRGIQTAPWLDEVTYLIDANGQTTAILEQTDKPTSGVSLEPVPFTPVQAAVISPTTETSPTSRVSVPAQTNAPLPSIPTLPSRNLTIALAVLGAILSLVLTGVIWYLLRRRNIQTRAQNTESKLDPQNNSRQSTPTYVLPPPQGQVPLEESKKIVINSMPRSIMKPPKSADSKGWLGPVQPLFGKVDDRGSKKIGTENEIGLRKKGVTFGENQIRIFGRTPLPSRTASLVSQDSTE